MFNYKNLWDAAKVEFKRKTYSIEQQIRKEERLQVNYLSF